jgi:ribonuclease P protein component
VNYSFKKEERLIKKKDFESLVKKGNIYFSYPLRAVWDFSEIKEEYPARVAFAVPKKKFKRANKRNTLKRRMREGYRLHKNPLYELLNKNNYQINILIVYIGNELIAMHDIEKKIIGLFHKIAETISKTSS